MTRPHIFISRGMWHVAEERRGIVCVRFILRRSAYAYAKAIWKRKAK